MNLTLTARHFEITPYLKTHVDEKMKRLPHFNNQVTSGEVVLFKEHAVHVAEGKVHFGHAVIAAKGEGSDMYIAVNDLKRPRGVRERLGEKTSATWLAPYSLLPLYSDA